MNGFGHASPTVDDSVTRRVELRRADQAVNGRALQDAQPNPASSPRLVVRDEALGHFTFACVLREVRRAHDSVRHLKLAESDRREDGFERHGRAVDQLFRYASSVLWK